MTTRHTGFFGYFGHRSGSDVAAIRSHLQSTSREEWTLLATATGYACFIAASPSVNVALVDDHLLVAVSGQFSFESNPLRRDAGTGTLARDIALAYQRDGADILKRLRGSFSLAICNIASRSILMSIDRIGIGRLYYSPSRSGAAFGTSLPDVIAQFASPPAIDPQSIFDYLYFHCIPSPRTIYQRIRKLKPAECFAWNDGNESVRTYWLPPLEGQERSSDKSALERELRTTLQHAVSSHARRRSRFPGAFLSGGLDSSTVAGMLQQGAAGDTHTFTIGFDAREYDESRFARISADHFHTVHHEYRVTPDDVRNAVTAIASHFDEPFGNSSAVAVYYCARLARDCGFDALLAGDGGDELFAGNERYATQALFEMYHSVPALIRRFAEFAYRRNPTLQQVPVLRKGHRYIVQAKVPLPDRLQRYNFMNFFPPEDVLSKNMLAGVDIGKPVTSLRERYNEPRDASTLNRMLYLDWKFTLADNDLVKVGAMCGLAGVDVSYPMLDDAVVDLSWSIPPAWKMPRRKLRGFYKHAFRDFLPGATLRKAKHGFGLPFGVWLRDDAGLKALASDALTSLKRRDLVSPEFIDRALGLHREGTAHYYGELVWILMMLENWFRADIRNPATAQMQLAPD